MTFLTSLKTGSSTKMATSASGKIKSRLQLTKNSNNLLSWIKVERFTLLSTIHNKMTISSKHIQLQKTLLWSFPEIKLWKNTFSLFIESEMIQLQQCLETKWTKKPFYSKMTTSSRGKMCRSPRIKMIRSCCNLVLFHKETKRFCYKLKLWSKMMKKAARKIQLTESLSANYTAEFSQFCVII